jgi:hypothetical protein
MNIQTYKHLPEDTVVNLLAFALIDARKMDQNIDGAAAAIVKVKKL